MDFFKSCDTVPYAFLGDGSNMLEHRNTCCKKPQNSNCLWKVLPPKGLEISCVLIL